MEPRLPAHLEVSGLVRQVNAAGGFAVVLHKGERDAGTTVVVIAENGGNLRIFERMPMLDGTRQWQLSRKQDIDKPQEIHEYLQRRSDQDPDLWLVELDIANGERLIGHSADEA